MANSGTLKETALDFLHRAARGDSREAFRLHAAPGFRHHNAYFKGDADTLMTAMEEAAKQNPGKTLEVQHCLQDGNLVAVHSHYKPGPAHRGMAVMHIFRFENDKIAEMWDFGQPVPEQDINENGMF